MTTIAWDGITLAADGMLIGDFIEQCDVKKIFKVGEHYFAGAGRVEAISAFAKDQTLGLPEGTDCIRVKIGAKSADYFQSGSPEPIRLTRPTALGTGANFAMGAMLSGKTAAQAVAIASKLDPNTGGKIKSVKIR